MMMVLATVYAPLYYELVIFSLGPEGSALVKMTEMTTSTQGGRSRARRSLSTKPLMYAKGLFYLQKATESTCMYEHS